MFIDPRVESTIIILLNVHVKLSSKYFSLHPQIMASLNIIYLCNYFAAGSSQCIDPELAKIVRISMWVFNTKLDIFIILYQGSEKIVKEYESEDVNGCCVMLYCGLGIATEFMNPQQLCLPAQSPNNTKPLKTQPQEREISRSFPSEWSSVGI